MPDQSNGKPTLEEILRAKREDRPDADFWRKFDRELNLKRRQLAQKQLAEESLFTSFMNARLTRFAAATGALSCGAFALYIGMQPEAATEAPGSSRSRAAKARACSISVEDAGKRSGTLTTIAQ